MHCSLRCLAAWFGFRLREWFRAVCFTGLFGDCWVLSGGYVTVVCWWLWVCIELGFGILLCSKMSFVF